MSFSFERLADYFVAVAELGAVDDPAKLRAIASILGFAEEKATAVVETAASTPIAPLARETPRNELAASMDARM